MTEYLKDLRFNTKDFNTFPEDPLIEPLVTAPPQYVKVLFEINNVKPFINNSIMINLTEIIYDLLLVDCIVLCFNMDILISEKLSSKISFQIQTANPR